MERHRFAQHLVVATQQAIEAAREYVINDLHGEVSYLLAPNQSNDEKLRVEETVYPEDSLPDGIEHGPWSADRVVEFLYRNGRVPEWIDIAVAEVSEEGEVRVELRCCGRFTATEQNLYYTWGPVPPFGVKSPVLPPGWETGGRKFDVNWRRDRMVSVGRRPWWKFWWSRLTSR